MQKIKKKKFMNRILCDQNLCLSLLYIAFIFDDDYYAINMTIIS